MSEVTILSEFRVFDGRLIRFKHFSASLNSVMTAAVYIPSGALENEKFPAVLYLSGLTCTDENVCQKSGVFKYLSQHRIGFIAPDTSPRGHDIPGVRDSWDFGEGAGFYLDATEPLWKDNFKMYSYVIGDLLDVVGWNFDIDTTRLSITGHSMGGHGALSIALKNSKMFRSVSAFAPICNPVNCPWGIKAFSGYLGADRESWGIYDSTILMRKLGHTLPYDDILIDVGTADNFYNQGQLLPENFLEAAKESDVHVSLRFQEGFDHSYYFVSSFMEDHIAFHASRLKK